MPKAKRKRIADAKRGMNIQSYYSISRTGERGIVKKVKESHREQNKQYSGKKM